MEVEKTKKKLERDLELELGDEYTIDLRSNWKQTFNSSDEFDHDVLCSSFLNLLTETWDLKNPEEKYDALPEIWKGHNVADFIDPEIMEVRIGRLH